MPGYPMNIFNCAKRSHVFLASLFPMLVIGGPIGNSGPPGQGVADLFLEYMEVRYPEQVIESDILYVSIRTQQLIHIKDGTVLAKYDISTATNGIGSQIHSNMTPTGLHKVCGMYGEGVPLFGVLKGRRYTGQLADKGPGAEDEDPITTRILHLEGMEPGVNKGGSHDSRARAIYIHGTADEGSIGTPSSKGCIRMRNEDVLELFEQLSLGALVAILDN